MDILKRGESYRRRVVLYITPSARITDEPTIDHLTMKMTAAFRKATIARVWRGWHTCACGAKSTNCDYELPNSAQTNSLAVHYLAWHRDEVPQSELDVVNALECGEELPAERELRHPDYQDGKPSGRRPVFR